jgi:hypothetical protein
MTETTTVWVCTNCQTSYEPGPARVCPACRRPDHYGQGVQPNMPKITVHGGPSNAAADSGAAEVAGSAAPEPQEETWAGNSSSTSSGSSANTPEPTESKSPEPAPSTGSLSGQDQMANSSASPTAGSGPETPKTYAAKAEWVEFVTANGWDVHEFGDPADCTKADLIDWWNRR